jgi:hypothetical protein
MMTIVIVFFYGCVTMKKSMATVVVFFGGFAAKKANRLLPSCFFFYLWWVCCKEGDGNKLSPLFIYLVFNFFSFSLVLLLQRIVNCSSKLRINNDLLVFKNV